MNKNRYEYLINKFLRGYSNRNNELELLNFTLKLINYNLLERKLIKIEVI